MASPTQKVQPPSEQGCPREKRCKTCVFCSFLAHLKPFLEVNALSRQPMPCMNSIPDEALNIPAKKGLHPVAPLSMHG
jgi:hypothetical protein